MLLCQQKQCSCFHHQLLWCIREGFNDEAQLHLQKIETICKVKINGSGKTLLHYAVKYENTIIVQHLVENGCDAHVEDYSNVTPLMLAVKIGNVIIVEILLKNSNVFENGMRILSPLESYFYNSLSISPSIFSRKNHQLTLEIIFESINKNFLMHKEPFLNLLQDANDVVKLVSVVFGNDELTMFMFDIGYNIDFQEPRMHSTALRCAIILGKVEKVKSLLQLGANVNVLDKYGSTLFIHYTNRFEWLDDNSEVLKTILDRSTTLYALNRYGFTDVKVLLRSGQKDTVRTVLQSCIDIDAGLGSSETLLHVLIQNRNDNVVDVLVELNISFDVKACDLENNTALAVAAACGSLHKVEFLLTHGAGKNEELHWALRNVVMFTSCSLHDKVKIIEHLLYSGADPQYVYYWHTFENKYTLIDYLAVYRPLEMPEIKIIVAHFAMLDAIDKSSLTKHTRNRIDAHEICKAHFVVCVQQLEKLKTAVVHGTVTLFKCLSESEEKLVAYSRNQEMIAVFETALTKMPQLESYYVNTLRKRIVRASDKMKVEDKVSVILGVLIGFCSDLYHVVVRKIISYLDDQDLDNLCKIERK